MIRSILLVTRRLYRQHTPISCLDSHSMGQERLPHSHIHSQHRGMPADRPGLRPAFQVFRRALQQPVPAAHHRILRRIHHILDILQRSRNNAPERQSHRWPALHHRQPGSRAVRHTGRIRTRTDAVNGSESRPARTKFSCSFEIFCNFARELRYVSPWTFYLLFCPS